MILVKYKRAHGLSMVKNQGEVYERLKVQSWKGCVGGNSTVGSNPTLSELTKE